jgi:hypothetical protein
MESSDTAHPATPPLRPVRSNPAASIPMSHLIVEVLVRDAPAWP